MGKKPVNAFRKYGYALFALPVLIQSAMWFVVQDVPARFDIWCPLDDMIPFCKYFVVPYLLWFPFYYGGVLLLLLRAKRAFITTCMQLAFGLVVAEFVFLFFQNQITFRPDGALAVTDFFSWAVAAVYAGGTTVSACPSLHCFVSCVVCIGFFKADCFRHKTAVRVCACVLTALIWMSTVFIKQHSVLDAAGALVLSAATCAAVYIPDWRFLRRGSRLFPVERGPEAG